MVLTNFLKLEIGRRASQFIQEHRKELTNHSANKITLKKDVG